jgi:serine/threonine-protein kinase
VQPGDVIDNKYRIESQLGEGGMGRVMAATHVEIGSTFAIKILKKDALSHPEVPARFMREARAAGRLRSEHVVRVVDVGRLASGEPYMVMEMLHGYDLASRLTKGALEPARAVEYIVQACEGLAEAHGLGMVHRDVKPANLFVTTRPNGAPLIKVLDFGIATAAIGDVDHRLTTTQSVIGSPSYMSPEQLRATRDVDPRSDIWSLGVTLYELLADRQPFVAPTITALSLKIVSDPHPPITGIPIELMAILDKCLEKERDARFSSVAELAEALAPLFPNGKVAAEMVSGAYARAVPPTIIEEAAVDPSAAGWRLPTTPPQATTTGFTAGESAALERPRRKKGWWIALGAIAMAGLGAAATLGWSSMTAGTTSAAAPPAPVIQPAVKPPPVVVQPPPPPPVVVEPATAPVPVVEEPPPVVKKPAKKPSKKPPKPVTKPDQAFSTPPPTTPQPAPELPKEPPKETPPPVKKPPTPCLPSDKTCGL